MCGRYFIGPGVAADPGLRGFLSQGRRRAERYEQLRVVFEGEVAPGDAVVAIANGKDLTPQGFPMRWGVQGPLPASRPLINARSETAEERRTFAAATRAHRCLLPASWYFEWSGRDAGHKKWAFRPQSGEPCLLAGLYLPQPQDAVAGPLKAARFVVLTREATPELARVHGRMPVVIPAGRAQRWLDLSLSFGAAVNLADTAMEAAPERF